MDTRLRTQSIRAGVAMLCVLFAWPCHFAQAHDFDARHRAIASVRAEKTDFVVDVLLLMELPPGKRATRLGRLYDIDRSGDLNAFESQMASSSLGTEVVGGYVLQFNGRSAQPQSAKATATLNGRGGLIVALLLEYRPKTQPTGTVRLELKVMTNAQEVPRRASPMLIEIQVSPPWSIRNASSKIATDAPVVGPTEIKPGQPGCWVEIEREEQ